MSKGKAYSFQVSHACLSKGDEGDGDKGTDSWYLSHGGLAPRCVEGDVVEMILDLDALELKYAVNDVEYGVAFKVENTSYRAVVSAYGDGDVLELLSYKNLKF